MPKTLFAIGFYGLLIFASLNLFWLIVLQLLK
jgi:hypothetical protein